MEWEASKTYKKFARVCVCVCVCQHAFVKEMMYSDEHLKYGLCTVLFLMCVCVCECVCLCVCVCMCVCVCVRERV